MSSLSPAVIAAAHDLELAARLVVEGLRAGGHRSPFHGYNAEFQQHRPYRTGDDLKYLDWKLLARTDRLFSKSFRETTSMSAMIVLDTSASMAFPETGISKFRYASIMAAALAWLISNQGDAVGFMTTANGAWSYLPARGGRPHLRSLITRIDRLQTGGAWQPDRVIERAAELLKRRGVILVLSDFYDNEETTRRELRRVAHRGHDVGMLQIVSHEELAFPFRGDLDFECLETGERRLLDAAAVGAQYRSAIREFLTHCRGEAQRDGIAYTLLSTGDPPERALREFLLRRAEPMTHEVAGRR
jgi:uncharacterized protein (DUF58 family)